MICQFCGNDYLISDFFTYADHAHDVGGPGNDAEHICRVCLYHHVTRYYPDCPIEHYLVGVMTDDERQAVGLPMRLQQMAMPLIQRRLGG